MGVQVAIHGWKGRRTWDLRSPHMGMVAIHGIDQGGTPATFVAMLLDSGDQCRKSSARSEGIDI